MATKKYSANQFAGPAWDLKTVSANDSTDLPAGPCRGIWVGTSGNVKITTLAGTAVVLKSLVAGMVHPIGATRIWAASLTAADVYAVY